MKIDYDLLNYFHLINCSMDHGLINYTYITRLILKLQNLNVFVHLFFFFLTLFSGDLDQEEYADAEAGGIVSNRTSLFLLTKIV